jgi:hypothetical protein
MNSIVTTIGAARTAKRVLLVTATIIGLGAPGVAMAREGAGYTTTASAQFARADADVPPGSRPAQYARSENNGAGSAMHSQFACVEGGATAHRHGALLADADANGGAATGKMSSQFA